MGGRGVNTLTRVCSCSDIEDDLESSDYMSEDESSTAPSVER